MQRGGQQFIPRPPDHAIGGPAPWSELSAAQRRFDLAAVRAAARTFASPRPVAEAHPDHLESAVLLTLFERAGEAHLIFIKRPETIATHKGQIAFPGGKADPEDADLAVTALRETWEEVGIPSDRIELVGALDVIPTIATPFVIAPFVGLLDAEPEYTLEPSEVAVIMELPLSELFDDATFREEHWEIPDGFPIPYGTPERSVYFYEVPGETIWGATARILTDFLSRLAATRA